MHNVLPSQIADDYLAEFHGLTLARLTVPDLDSIMQHIIDNEHENVRPILEGIADYSEAFRDKIEYEFAIVAPFYEGDSNEFEKGVAEWGKMYGFEAKALKRANELETSVGGELNGLMLENDGDRKRYTILLDDASKPGRARMSRYDEYGFYSHDDFLTLRDALIEAIQEGFTKRAEKGIDELATTEKWALGTAITGAILEGKDPFAIQGKRANNEDQLLELATHDLIP